MQQGSNVLPHTLSDWLVLIGIVVGWVASVVLLWQRMTNKVNGLGERVNALEDSSAEKKGRMDRNEREIELLHNAVTGGAERLGRMERSIEGLEDHVTEMKIEITGAVGEIKNIILEKNASVRERIVRIESKLEIDSDP